MKTTHYKKYNENIPLQKITMKTTHYKKLQWKQPITKNYNENNQLQKITMKTTHYKKLQWKQPIKPEPFYKNTKIAFTTLYLFLAIQQMLLYLCINLRKKMSIK